MSKRGDNIRKRKDGRWEGRYKKGRSTNGSLLYGSVYGKTYREVKEKLSVQAKEPINTTLVCATPKYRPAMEPALTRLSLRYRYYAKKFGEAYGCDTEIIEPFVYMTITAVVNYMIFEEETYIEPQLDYVQKKIETLSQNKEQKGVSDEN